MDLRMVLFGTLPGQEAFSEFDRRVLRVLAEIPDKISGILKA